MGSVLFVLEHLDSLTTKSTPAGRDRSIKTWVVAAAIALGAIAAGLGVWLARPVPSGEVTRTAITLSGDLPLSGEGVALSPDGRTLAIPAGN
jgi:hypothetical protein